MLMSLFPPYELKIFFFNICLYVDIVQLPQRNMHWKEGNFGGKFVAKVMPQRRFLAVSFNLHWYYTSQVKP